jgi:hypothetical protein
MFGRAKWEKAEATIIASEFGLGTSLYTWFVADVKTPDGQIFRTKLKRPRASMNFWEPYPGAVVGVEYDPKSRQARFDTSDPRNDGTQVLRAQRSQAQDLLSQGPGPGPGSSPVPGPKEPTDDEELKILMDMMEEEEAKRNPPSPGPSSPA